MAVKVPSPKYWTTRELPRPYYYYFLIYLLATPHGMWDFISLTRDWTHVLCLDSVESNHWTTRGAPWLSQRRSGHRVCRLLPPRLQGGGQEVGTRASRSLCSKSPKGSQPPATCPGFLVVIKLAPKVIHQGNRKCKRGHSQKPAQESRTEMKEHWIQPISSTSWWTHFIDRHVPECGAEWPINAWQTLSFVRAEWSEVITLLTTLPARSPALLPSGQLPEDNSELIPSTTLSSPLALLVLFFWLCAFYFKRMHLNLFPGWVLLTSR